MRAAFYHENGAARDVLQVGEVETPTPGAGEVLVRIKASGVNPSDVKSRQGGPGRALAFPQIVPHSDGAGIIEQVGKGVDKARAGERVWIWNGQWKRPFGTAAEYIAVPAAQAVPLPDGVDFEAGACFGIPALTAQHAVTIGGSVAGQRVLITGGAGAVGHYAIQFAKMKGAEVITTISTPQKAEHARAAGADHVINYKTQDVGAAVKDITGGAKVDRIIDLDFGGNQFLIPTCLKPGGLVVVYGSNDMAPPLQILPLLVYGACVQFFIVYELTAEDRDKGIADINTLITSDAMRHTIAAQFSLEDIVKAHELVESGTAMGNVVIHP